MATMARKDIRFAALSRRIVDQFDKAALALGRNDMTHKQADLKAAYDGAYVILLNRMKQLHAYKRRCDKLEEQVATLQAQLAARNA